MELALFVLKTGEVLVSASETLEMEPRAHLRNPHQVTGKTKLTLTPWLGAYTNEKHLLLHTEAFLTVCEPNSELVKLYLSKTGEPEETYKPKEEDKVLLNEDEQLPQDTWVDDYEPNYAET